MVQRRYVRQIIIRYYMHPQAQDYDAELDWIFRCIGLGDTTDEIAKGIFRGLVKASRERKGVSSRELIGMTGVTQAAIVYHLNTFIRSGLVMKQGRNYFLRGGSLEHALDEIENDMVRKMGKLKEIARKIDEGR